MFFIARIRIEKITLQFGVVQCAICESLGSVETALIRHLGYILDAFGFRAAALSS